jgi:hypothetical protein
MESIIFPENQEEKEMKEVDLYEYVICKDVIKKKENHKREGRTREYIFERSYKNGNRWKVPGVRIGFFDL